MLQPSRTSSFLIRGPVCMCCIVILQRVLRRDVSTSRNYAAVIVRLRAEELLGLLAHQWLLEVLLAQILQLVLRKYRSSKRILGGGRLVGLLLRRGTCGYNIDYKIAVDSRPHSW